MKDPAPNPFGDVVAQYARMEPDGTDSWNPLRREWELLYRLALYDHLCVALARWGGDVSRLRVLDVGCGNGRSTRVYLDFGLRPEQITGIDLRPAAIELARGRHPGIRYLVQRGAEFPVADADFDWVSLCTVMSSIPRGAARGTLASEVGRVLEPGGRLFYFDRQVAHGFAGGDELVPERIFEGLELEASEAVNFHGRIERLVPGGPRSRLLLPILRFLIHRPTHRSSVFTRPRRSS